MSAYIVLDTGTDRTSWLAARCGVVTATDVARLARGGAGTWAAIRAEKEGRGRDFKNAAMQHGIDREPFLAAYAKSAFGLAHSTALLAAADRPSYAATPDLIGANEVGDIKTTVHDWPTLSDAPARYIDQILWQMRVTGIHQGRLVFEPHENGIPVYPFPRDFVIEWNHARVAELEAVADEFLAGDVEPDEHAAELDAALAVYVDLDDMAAAAAARRDEQRARIEDLIGSQPTRFEGSVANLTRSADGTSNRFDSTALKAADPDLYTRFVKPTPTKGRLTITPRSAA